jgi:signal transduction histidine kinase
LLVFEVEDAHDARGCVHWMTPKAIEILGLSSEALDLVGYDNQPSNWHLWPDALQPFVTACQVQTESGEIARAEMILGDRVLGYSIRWLQKPMLKVITFSDITNIKKQDADAQAMRDELSQSRKLAAMGTLIATIGHEIKLPLVGIGMNIQLAQMALTNYRQNLTLASDAKHLEVKASEDWMMQADIALGRATQAVKNGADLLGDLLSYSRPAHLDERPVDVETLIRRAATTVSEAMPDWQSTTFVLNVALEVPVRVQADPIKLEHVFQNLFRNAIEATAKPITLTVTLKTQINEAEAQQVCILVSDDGPGIPEAIQERIFEPFFSTKAAKGTGLGLSTCYRMVDEHGGTLSLVSSSTDSAAGNSTGSTFRVVLPLAPDGLEPQGRAETLLETFQS